MFPTALHLAFILMVGAPGVQAPAEGFNLAINDERNGIWVERGLLGGFEVSYYNAGERTGGYTLISEKGFVMATGAMNHGRESGPFTLFYPTGRVRASDEYSNGQRHGRHQEFHENGRLRVDGEYQCGYRVGRWIEYNIDGQVITSSDLDFGHSRLKVASCEPKQAGAAVR